LYLYNYTVTVSLLLLLCAKMFALLYNSSYFDFITLHVSIVVFFAIRSNFHARFMFTAYLLQDYLALARSPIPARFSRQLRASPTATGVSSAR